MSRRPILVGPFCESVSHEISFIKNPSEEVQIAAVTNCGWVIRDIKNPSEAVKLAAVRQYGWAIQLIKNPSEAVKRAAVTQRINIYFYVVNLSW